MNIYNDGFYKFDGDLSYSENSVEGNGFCLYKENKDTYIYPVENWYWFDSIEIACERFNLDIEKYKPTISSSLMYS